MLGEWKKEGSELMCSVKHTGKRGDQKGTFIHGQIRQAHSRGPEHDHNIMTYNYNWPNTNEGVIQFAVNVLVLVRQRKSDGVSHP